LNNIPKRLHNLTVIHEKDIEKLPVCQDSLTFYFCFQLHTLIPLGPKTIRVISCTQFEFTILPLSTEKLQIDNNHDQEIVFADNNNIKELRIRNSTLSNFDKLKLKNLQIIKPFGLRPTVVNLPSSLTNLVLSEVYTEKLMLPHGIENLVLHKCDIKKRIIVPSTLKVIINCKSNIQVDDTSNTEFYEIDDEKHVKKKYINGFIKNPFKSEAQRRYMHMYHPEIAKRWEHGQHSTRRSKRK